MRHLPSAAPSPSRDRRTNGAHARGAATSADIGCIAAWRRVPREPTTLGALTDFAEYRIHDHREAARQPAFGRPASRRIRIPHALGRLAACFSPPDERRFLRTSSARFLASRQAVPRAAAQGSTKIRTARAETVPSNPIDGTSSLETAGRGPSPPIHRCLSMPCLVARHRTCLYARTNETVPLARGGSDEVISGDPVVVVGLVVDGPSEFAGWPFESIRACDCDVPAPRWTTIASWFGLDYDDL